MSLLVAVQSEFAKLDNDMASIFGDFARQKRRSNKSVAKKARTRVRERFRNVLELLAEHCPQEFEKLTKSQRIQKILATSEKATVQAIQLSLEGLEIDGLEINPNVVRVNFSNQVLAARPTLICTFLREMTNGGRHMSNLIGAVWAFFGC